MTFTLTLHDRNGKPLSEGDIVKISDGKHFTFYSEVKCLEKEKAIAPFHTFSFHSFEKVDKLPDGMEKSTEKRYNIWWSANHGEPEKDISAKDHRDYLMSWRECEIALNKRCFQIDREMKLF